MVSVWLRTGCSEPSPERKTSSLCMGGVCYRCLSLQRKRAQNREPHYSARRPAFCTLVLVMSKVFQTSGFRDSELESLKSKIVALNGQFRGSQRFDAGCTHLIVPASTTLSKMTEKLCACLAAGKWVLTVDYVTKSFARNEWLVEEQYERFARSRSPVLGQSGGIADGLFAGWTVLLYMSDSQIKSMYRRVLLAGGAVLLPDQPLRDETDCLALKPITQGWPIFVVCYHKDPFSQDLREKVERRAEVMSTTQILDHIRCHFSEDGVDDMSDSECHPIPDVSQSMSAASASYFNRCSEVGILFPPASVASTEPVRGEQLKRASLPSDESGGTDANESQILTSEPLAICAKECSGNLSNDVITYPFVGSERPGSAALEQQTASEEVAAAIQVLASNTSAIMHDSAPDMDTVESVDEGIGSSITVSDLLNGEVFDERECEKQQVGYGIGMTDQSESSACSSSGEAIKVCKTADNEKSKTANSHEVNAGDCGSEESLVAGPGTCFGGVQIKQEAGESSDLDSVMKGSDQNTGSKNFAPSQESDPSGSQILSQLGSAELKSNSGQALSEPPIDSVRAIGTDAIQSEAIETFPGRSPEKREPVTKRKISEAGDDDEEDSPKKVKSERDESQWRSDSSAPDCANDPIPVGSDLTPEVLEIVRAFCTIEIPGSIQNQMNEN